MQGGIIPLPGLGGSQRSPTHRTRFSSDSGVPVGLFYASSPLDCLLRNAHPSGHRPSERLPRAAARLKKRKHTSAKGAMCAPLQHLIPTEHASKRLPLRGAGGLWPTEGWCLPSPHAQKASPCTIAQRGFSHLEIIPGSRGTRCRSWPRSDHRAAGSRIQRPSACPSRWPSCRQPPRERCPDPGACLRGCRNRP